MGLTTARPAHAGDRLVAVAVKGGRHLIPDHLDDVNQVDIVGDVPADGGAVERHHGRGRRQVGHRQLK